MNYAVIDLGSNTMRLSIYEQAGDEVHKVYNKKEVAGLAEYIKKGELSSEGIGKACAVLNDFKETASKFVDLRDLHLFATASIRNIKNRSDAVSRIIETTGLSPDILEGTEEAALSYIGASRFVDCDNGIMIDIGGASTELVLFKEHEIVNSISLPVGCLNLSVEHVSRIIPDEDEWKNIKEAVREQFAAVDWGESVTAPLLVGVGGTLRAALKLANALYDSPPGLNELSADNVREIARLLRENKDNIYHTVYKTTPERLMTIPTGIIILQQAIKLFGCERISVSRYGIREGYLIDRVLLRNGKYSIDERSMED